MGRTRWRAQSLARLGPAVAIALLLGGCISAFPEDALRGVDRSLTVAALRAAPAGSHVNARVVAGGEILATRPKTGSTEIELLSRPLRVDDSPEHTDRSDGRVLVRSRSFLDPAVYAAGRRVTVLGTVTGAEERGVGDLPYVYPVIEMEQMRLWPRPADYAGYPPYYDPYWPYWGWGPYWRPYRGWGPWPHRW